MRKYIYLALCVFVYAIGIINNAVAQVKPDDNRLQMQGRIALSHDVAEIYWPGSSYKIKFKGTSIKAILKDEKGYNYFNVIVDGSLLTALKIDTVKKTYTLVSGLADQPHTVELSKRADWFRGKSWFYGFELGPGAEILSIEPKKRTIEFYGNSITVGASVEDDKGDSGDSTYTNNFKSYASVTARHFDANYSCIASSGIGLLISWGSLIMPDIYNRLNPDDSSSVWDFSKIKPGVVVINLFQNDYALFNHPEHPQFKRRFGEKAPDSDSVVRAYAKFVKQLRAWYPDSYIICVLGCMDAVRPGSPWPGYIETAVASLQDKKIFTHFFPYRNRPGHPKEKEHEQMAAELIAVIEQHVKW